jgi:hypothetical protein
VRRWTPFHCGAALSTDEIARDMTSLLPNEPRAYTNGLAVMFQLLELGLLEMRSERVSSAVAENESLIANE